MAKVSSSVIDVVSEPVLSGSETKPRGRGRPAGSTAKGKVAEATYDGDYAASNQKFNSFDEFLQWLKRYPDKRGLSLYLYRVEPVINLGLIGQKNSYIDVFGDVDAVSRESIQREHGGGKFKLMLSDSNRRAGFQQMASTMLDIDMALAAPVLNPLSLVLDDPRKNQGYIQSQIATGVLVRDDAGQVKVRTEATMESVLQAVKSATGAAGPSPVGHVGQPSFTEQLALKLIDRYGGAPAAANSGDTIQQALQLAEKLHPQSQNSINEKLVALMLDKLTAPPAVAPAPAPVAGPDIFESYERIETMLEKLGAGRGAVVANASGFQQAMTFVTELLKVVPMGVQIYQSMAAQRAAQGLPPLPGPGPLPGPVAVPFAASYAQPGPVAVAGPVVLDQSQNGGGGMANWMDPAFQGRLLQTGERALGAFHRGVSGFDFALGLCAMESDGVAIFEALDSLGPGLILSTLGSVPQGAALVADLVSKERLEAWVSDFLSFDPKAPSETPELDSAA